MNVKSKGQLYANDHGFNGLEKMDICVCLIYWEGFGRPWSYARQLYPPLGTMYVAAALKDKVRKVSIIDAAASRYTIKDILKLLRIERPEYIGFTIYINQVNSSMKLAKIIKEHLPESKIILGGPHVLIDHEQILLKCSEVDYCIRGEGEYTLLNLLEALYYGKTLEGILGVTYRKNGEIRSNPSAPIINDLDKLTFPARKLTPYWEYRSTESMGGKKHFTTMIASRGCPHNCTYCDSAARWNRKIHFRSPENVIQEMIEVQKDLGVKYIRFVDDYFTAKRGWVERFCELYHQNNLMIEWQCSCRVESIDLVTIQHMKKARCRVISLGIEFGNEKIRKLVRKRFSNEQIGKAVKIIQDVGIKTYGLFMLGYPTETEFTIRETIEMAVGLDLDMAGFSIVTPYPGTELYEYCRKNNLLKTHDLDKYGTAKEPVFSHDNLTSEQLMEMQGYARRRFYMRPRFLVKRMRTASPRDLYLLFMFLRSLLLKAKS